MLRRAVGRLWSGLGRLLRAAKPSPAMGFISAPVAALGLLGPVLNLVKLAVVVALVWGGVLFGISRMKAHYVKIGYEQGVRETAAEINRDSDAKVAEAAEAVKGLAPVPVEAMELANLCNADMDCRDRKGAK